jgi:hypothetical protein
MRQNRVISWLLHRDTISSKPGKDRLGGTRHPGVVQSQIATARCVDDSSVRASADIHLIGGRWISPTRLQSMSAVTWISMR